MGKKEWHTEKYVFYFELNHEYNSLKIVNIFVIVTLIAIVLGFR